MEQPAARDREEVIRLELNTYDVTIEFSTFRLAIGSAFRLVDQDGVIHQYDPTSKAGDVTVLWNLIGWTLTTESADAKFPWLEEVRLTFENGAHMVIAASTHTRGTAVGKTMLSYDDF